ncbi:MAG: polymer-forming cytoskeletal protein [Roseburia sp.]
MGFFKDFKDDFSQAVNELMPGEDHLEAGSTEDDLVVNTLEGEVDVASELSKLDGLLEQVKKEPSQELVQTAAAVQSAGANPVEEAIPEMAQSAIRTTKGERKMADNHNVTPAAPASTAAPVQAPAQERIISDEVSIITEGTIINGDVISNGSLDVRGQVDGNVSCNGKLTVTGVVNGSSNTSEFFADGAQVEGEVISTGTVKIGLGSVIIGNVSSTSAVIAGAIKGDIDVQGPVVVDTSVVVMGNIKSRSVQINNGAVIEGFCSQCYADVDVQSLFSSKKGN